MPSRSASFGMPSSWRNASPEAALRISTGLGTMQDDDAPGPLRRLRCAPSPRCSGARRRAAGAGVRPPAAPGSSSTTSPPATPAAARPRTNDVGLGVPRAVEGGHRRASAPKPLTCTMSGMPHVFPRSRQSIGDNRVAVRSREPAIADDGRGDHGDAFIVSHARNIDRPRCVASVASTVTSTSSRPGPSRYSTSIAAVLPNPRRVGNAQRRREASSGSVRGAWVGTGSS